MQCEISFWMFFKTDHFSETHETLTGNWNLTFGRGALPATPPSKCVPYHYSVLQNDFCVFPFPLITPLTGRRIITRLAGV